jgi:hypothetical protein
MTDHKDLSDKDRKEELEAELERHKQRFLSASRRGLDALRSDVSLSKWVGKYPVQATLLAFAGGFFLGVAKSLDRSKASSLP